MLIRGLFYNLLGLIFGVDATDLIDELDEMNDKELESMESVKATREYAEDEDNHEALNTGIRLGLLIVIIGTIIAITSLIVITAQFVGYRTAIISFIITDVIFAIKSNLTRG